MKDLVDALGQGVMNPRTTLGVVAIAMLFLFAAVVVAALVLYAHLIPALRAIGTALLARASVVSIVFGFAAQSAPGNIVAGFSLVLYRPVRVGDTVQLTTPKALVVATGSSCQTA